MINENLVIDVQNKEFFGWNFLRNTSSWISYVRASMLRILINEIKEQDLENKTSLRILDYGFGHGHALFHFNSSSWIYGVDISETAIKSASKRAAKKGYEFFEFKKPPFDNSIRIEYPSSFFDVVICSHTIEHVFDDEALLKELYRVLRPGGKSFLLVPLDFHDDLVKEDAGQRVNPLFPKKSFHVWKYNMETFQYLVTKSEFSIVSSKSLDAIWHERLGWNRAYQIFSSIMFAVMPFRFWQKLDIISFKRGNPYMQAVIVATK